MLEPMLERSESKVQHIHPVLAIIAVTALLAGWVGMIYFFAHLAGWHISYWRALAVLGLSQVIIAPSLLAMHVKRA